jgi:hypothetical protein
MPKKGQSMSQAEKEKMSQARLGKKHSQEQRERVSKTLKEKYALGIYTPAFKGKHLSEEHKQKLSQANQGKKKPTSVKKISVARKMWFSNPENKERFVKEILPKINSPENIAKRSATIKTKPLNLERVKKMAETKRRQYHEGQLFNPVPKGSKRPEISKKMKGRVFTPEWTMKISKALTGRKLDPITAKKVADAVRRRYSNPILKEQIIKKAWASRWKRPTGYEAKIIKIIKENGFPFKYVGDGSFLVGCKNPDFISTDGTNMIIEVYHNYTHPIDYEQRRSNYFTPRGYKLLFIDDQDLKRDDWISLCSHEIKLFMASCQSGQVIK